MNILLLKNYRTFEFQISSENLQKIFALLNNRLLFKDFDIYLLYTKVLKTILLNMIALSLLDENQAKNIDALFGAFKGILLESQTLDLRQKILLISNIRNEIHHKKTIEKFDNLLVEFLFSQLESVTILEPNTANDVKLALTSIQKILENDYSQKTAVVNDFPFSLVRETDRKPNFIVIFF